MAKRTLNRKKVLQAAFALADEIGLDALSMRKLGRKVGVEAMSLYNHVANKDDLLDGLVELIVAEIELPRTDDGWREGMRRRAVSARKVFNDHAWAITLMESRTNPGPMALQYYEANLACLRRDGFSLADAGHAFALLDAYIYGFALQEQTLPFETEGDLEAVAAGITEHLPADRFPCFLEFTTQHVLQPGYSFAAEFDFGLDLILDGLARLRGRTMQVQKGG